MPEILNDWRSTITKNEQEFNYSNKSNTQADVLCPSNELVVIRNEERAYSIACIFTFLRFQSTNPSIYVQQSCRWAIMWRNRKKKRKEKKKKGKKTNETRMESLLQITREMFRSFVFANGRQLRLFTWNWMKITPPLERCTIELNRRVSMAGEKGQRNWQIYNGKEWKKNVVGVMRISLVTCILSVYT